MLFDEDLPTGFPFRRYDIFFNLMTPFRTSVFQVGLAMAVSRGVADVESIAKALSPTNIRLAPPMVPGTGLLMVS